MMRMKCYGRCDGAHKICKFSYNSSLVNKTYTYRKHHRVEQEPQGPFCNLYHI